jgi:hypothetical protein
MFIVMILQRFELEESPKNILKLPFPVKIETNMIGYVPVYETYEQAHNEYPDKDIVEIRLKERK